MLGRLTPAPSAGGAQPRGTFTFLGLKDEADCRVGHLLPASLVPGSLNQEEK